MKFKFIGNEVIARFKYKDIEHKIKGNSIKELIKKLEEILA
ncbi:MAG: hypothetical protein ACRCZ0_12530 [Cetobacterium sp.]